MFKRLAAESDSDLLAKLATPISHSEMLSGISLCFQAVDVPGREPDVRVSEPQGSQYSMMRQGFHPTRSNRATVGPCLGFYLLADQLDPLNQVYLP